MSDLIKRLRDGCVDDKSSDWWQVSEHLTDSLMSEAAYRIEKLEAENAALKQILQDAWDKMPLEWKLHHDATRAIIQDAAIAAQSPTDK